MIAISWLLLVLAPMVKRDNENDPQKILQDSQAKIDEVRSRLHDLQEPNIGATNKGESIGTLPFDGK